MKFLYLLLFLVFTQLNSLFAQKKGLINSGELIQKSIVLHDSSDYKGAIALLDQINRSDTNYVEAVYRKAINCEADSQFTQAVKYCKEALARKEQRDFEPDIRNIYGNTLSDLKQYDEAVKVFDQAIAKYPYYALLVYNKGTIMMMQERWNDAELLFQKALLINPYMYSAHYQLALAAVRQGKLIPAFLSSVGYLLASPRGKYFSGSVNILSQISKNADEVVELKSKRKETPDANYQMIEEIVLSKIAIDKQYKLLTSLDDVLSRQIQVVFEKLEYDSKSNDFWIQYYLPYYKQVYNTGKMDPFIFHIFSNAKVPVIQEYNEKNKKTLEAFTTEAANYFNLIRATQKLKVNDRDTVTKKFIYENGKLAGRGRLTADGKKLLGAWKFYYPGGNLEGIGNYSETGTKEGDWFFYTNDGQVQSKQHFLNGKQSGRQEFYHDNGNPRAYENELNGDLEGPSSNYYYNGSIKSEWNYKLGKKQGEEKVYYDNGNIKAINTYANGALNGTYKEFYQSGQLKATGVYVAGKEDGPYKSYHQNGKLSIELMMIKDKVEGEWKSSYDSGKIKEKRFYVANTEEGLHEEYYDNGQLHTSYTAKKGKINGPATFYSKTGKVYSKLMYNNGVVTNAEYLDPLGKRLFASELKGNKIDIISFSANGVKTEHQFYDAKGATNGADTSFYPSGKVSSTAIYTDDELNGPFVSYYINGKKKAEVNMVKGKKNGYYQKYYVNGQTETEGWIQDGDYQGEWLEYDMSGKITDRSYYLDNELNGYKETFDLNGKKTNEQKYVRGILFEMTQYGGNGQVIAVDSFPKASGKIRYISAPGKVTAEGTLTNGSMNGSYKTFFFDGSVETIMSYKRGFLDSTYTSFYYGGVKHAEGHYASGDKAGKWQYFNEDGKITRAANYYEGSLNGEYVYYNPNGTKDYVSVYKDDELNGAAQQFDQAGALTYQLNFEDDYIRSYTYPGADGKLIADVLLPHGNGSFKSFFANGKVSRECTYSDGKRNGPMTTYYSNGQVQATDNSVFGINEGPMKEYYPNGNLTSEYNYVADNINGAGKEYYANGKLKKEATYINGDIHGQAKYYDESGKLVKTLFYDYDKLTGVKNEK